MKCPHCGAMSTRDSIIRFSVFELNFKERVLRKNGIRIRCQGQPLQVLAALLEKPGTVVTREEFRQRIWPEDTFVDFDHALNTAIKKLRGALGDDTDAPRYIETVPRCGYRFIGSIEPPVNSFTPRRVFLVVALALRRYIQLLLQV